VNFWPLDGILVWKHRFLSSRNNDVAKQRSISLFGVVNPIVVTLMPNVLPYFLEVRDP